MYQKLFSFKFEFQIFTNNFDLDSFFDFKCKLKGKLSKLLALHLSSSDVVQVFPNLATLIVIMA